MFFMVATHMVLMQIPMAISSLRSWDMIQIHFIASRRDISYYEVIYRIRKDISQIPQGIYIADEFT